MFETECVCVRERVCEGESESVRECEGVCLWTMLVHSVEITEILVKLWYNCTVGHLRGKIVFYNGESKTDF